MIPMLHPGLYEQLINHTLRRELDVIPPERKSVAPVDPAEAAEVLSRYIAEAAKRALSGMKQKSGAISACSLPSWKSCLRPAAALPR